MNKIAILILAITATCLLCFYKSSVEKNKELDNKHNHIQQIVDKEVSEFIKQPEYSAISGAIYVNGKTYQFHFGKLINGKKADNQTIYEIGSITKTFTGLILSQAVYDKIVNLDDDIRMYLDGEFPNLVLAHSNPITLRHLITHTSGLPLVNNCNISGQTIEEQITCFKNFTKDAFFEELKNVKLIDNSGKNYNYSGVGTQLVGYVLERVYQLSYQELLKKYVFTRYGEQNTFSELKYDENTNISTGKDSRGVVMPLINGFYEYSGGAKSTTKSMLSYIRMYLESDDPVVEQAMDLLAGNKQYGRSYAWNTYNYDQNRKMLYHNGSTFGHSSWIALYPNQKTGIFLVTNVLTEDSQGKLNELSNKIIDKIIKNDT